MNEFERAAKPLCDKIESNTTNITYYYGAWVKTKNNTYKDMFMGCCKLCQMLNAINWIIKLKIQIVILSKFALQRNDILLFRKKLNSFIDTQYLATKQNFGIIPACESSTYHLIPVLLGNRVGFVGAFDRLNWEGLLLRALAPPRQKDVTYMGRYTSAIANKYNKNHCLNTYATTSYSVCVVYVLLTKHYGYECCCYGDKIPRCQERIRNAIRTGPTVDELYRNKMTCVIDGSSMSHSSKVNHGSDGIEFKGNVDDLMNEMQKTFCELHLKFNGNKEINVYFNSYFITKQLILSYQEVAKATEQITISDINELSEKQQTTLPNLSILNKMEQINYYKKLIEQRVNIITNSFQCINLSNWDSRASDILRFHCAQLLPLDAQCPFTTSRTFAHYHIMCCCNDRSFCNYNVDIIKRTATKSIPNLCKFNNEYQYFLHDYFYPTEPDANHSCLLHFISGNALYDMNYNFKRKNSVIFFLPGSAIQPIDFSYALLEPNECDYLDVDLKYDYLQTRYCYKSTKLLKYLETTYMPLRLFACRCQTAPGEIPCDSILMENIAEKAQNSNRKYYCAKYKGKQSLLFNHRIKIKVNDLSPYCATILDFKAIGNNLYYEFSGNAVRRTFINQAKFKLAMIPFTMYALSGESTQLCMNLIENEMIMCICRNEYNNRKPCNLNSYEKGKALQFAIHQINLSKTRRMFPNELLTYSTSNEHAYCHSESIFSTIIVNCEKKEAKITSACVKKIPKFDEEENDDLVCAEKLFYEECGIVSELSATGDSDKERIVCCCIDNCDSIGLALHEFKAEMHFLMENN
uniref:Bm1147 n=3 Tax=Brugia malayi TaxID=6279 RepID=A0A8L7YIA7_BRUMA